MCSYLSVTCLLVLECDHQFLPLISEQTEQASLSSQHASVWARCSESEARAAALEAESKVWSRDREEVTMRGEALRRDHERLSALQQRQEAELEALLSKHSQLKTNSRNLEAQHRELEGR